MCTVLKYPFLVTDPKSFLKAPSVTDPKSFLKAPKSIKFEGRARVKIFQKVPKNAYFGLFFQNFAWCDQTRDFLLLWKSLENQFDRLIKIDKFL